MSPDRELIDTIKAHFARKSTAQLQEIVQANNPVRWSPEAVAAADELLMARLAGHAAEPDGPEEEEAPPPYVFEPNAVLMGVLLGLLTGHLHVHMPRRKVEDPDQPLPFGPQVAWLALDTTDIQAVAGALGLRNARAVTWEQGVEAAYRLSVFVTPPLGDWTLAVSTALFPLDGVEAFVKPLLERLSRQFGDAQYFCTQRDLELHAWSRARKGRLVRGYGWLGQQGLTLWDEGAPTRDERDLGFRPSEEQSPAAGQGDDEVISVPDEDFVMQLASLWSIDPTTLDEQFKEPRMGLLGGAPWLGSRAGQ